MNSLSSIFGVGGCIVLTIVAIIMLVYLCSLHAANKKAQKKVQEKVIICGISRDNIKTFPNIKQWIESTGNRFADYRVIIFENDSVDGTTQFLREWSKNNFRVKSIHATFGNIKRPCISFLAKCRNKYLRELNKSKYDNYKYVIMVDMDIKHPWPIDSIVDSINNPAKNNWDVLCSNSHIQNGHLYDSFAYRDVMYSKLTHDHVANVQKKNFSENDKNWKSVYSCFGGLAIYKRDSLASCMYDENSEDCEHVSLHECIRNKNGNIFIVPNIYFHI